MTYIPKVFLSYSHTSEEYQARVERLAQHLGDRGIEAIADFNTLIPGNDLFVFMERIALDENINKILCIIDERYTQNFNVRKSGIGTEAVLITPLLMQDHRVEGEQDETEEKEIRFKKQKIIPVIFDVDQHLQPVEVPAALKSLVHVDLSTEELYGKNLDRLVNAIFGRPLVAKPRVTPEESKPDPSRHDWWSPLPRAIEVYVQKNQVALARGTLEELYKQGVRHFAEEYACKLDRRELALFTNRCFDHAQTRNTLVEVWSYLLQYQPDAIDLVSVRKFFEGIAALNRGNDRSGYQKWQVEHIRLAITDLFLHFVALLLDRERFSTLEELLNMTFRVHLGYREWDTGTYEVIHHPLDLQYAFSGLDFAELYSDALKPVHVTYSQLQDADLLLATRLELQSLEETGILNHYWWPYHTLMGSNDHWIRTIENSMFTTRLRPQEVAQTARLLGYRDVKALKHRFEQFVSSKKHRKGHWIHLCQIDALPEDQPFS